MRDLTAQIAELENRILNAATVEGAAKLHERLDDLRAEAEQGDLAGRSAEYRAGYKAGHEAARMSARRAAALPRPLPEHRDAD